MRVRWSAYASGDSRMLCKGLRAVSTTSVSEGRAGLQGGVAGRGCRAGLQCWVACQDPGPQVFGVRVGCSHERYPIAWTKLTLLPRIAVMHRAA